MDMTWFCNGVRLSDSPWLWPILIMPVILMIILMMEK